MSYLLFVDESGQDRQESPYEVLAGVAIEDSLLWRLVQSMHAEEVNYFGMRVTNGPLELKGKKLLKRKVFRHANQMQPFSFEERRELARRCLEKKSSNPTRDELTALAQARIAFVERLFELCAQHHCHAFASIVDRDAERPAGDLLRKDYAYLFERFFYFLEDKQEDCMGMIVFDELEKSRCHILIDQMEAYFLKTGKGRMRSSRIIPEPFFVHSELTSAIQIADLLAYVIAWGVRVGTMQRDARHELSGLASRACQLRYKTWQEVLGRDDFTIWSFAVIDDLRPRNEREFEE